MQKDDRRNGQSGEHTSQDCDLEDKSKLGGTVAYWSCEFVELLLNCFALVILRLRTFLSGLGKFVVVGEGGDVS